MGVGTQAWAGSHCPGEPPLVPIAGGDDRPHWTKDHQSNSIWNKEEGEGCGGDFSGAQKMVVASLPEQC